MTSTWSLLTTPWITLVHTTVFKYHYCTHTPLVSFDYIQCVTLYEQTTFWEPLLPYINRSSPRHWSERTGEGCRLWERQSRHSILPQRTPAPMASQTSFSAGLRETNSHSCSILYNNNSYYVSQTPPHLQAEDADDGLMVADAVLHFTCVILLAQF